MTRISVPRCVGWSMQALFEGGPATTSLPAYFSALWGIAPSLVPLQRTPNEDDVPPRAILGGDSLQVLH